MPAASMVTKLSTPDPCGAPPRVSISGSPDVFIENLAALRQGDSFAPHACPGSPPHGAVTTSGSPTVFVNNIPIDRIGDGISCGSLVAEGATSVFVNEGSSIIQGEVTILNDQLDRKNISRLADGYREWSGTTVVNVVQGTGLEIADDEYENADGQSDLYPPAPQTVPPQPISPSDIESTAPDAGPTSTGTPITDCSAITEPIDYNWFLSSHFQLKQLSITAVFPHTIKAQRGLTVPEIVCNLKGLCENMLEPIWAQYPQFRINSSFRTFDGSTSHHHLGWAADLQWPHFSYNDYFAVATWIQNNFSFTQLLLEHSSSGTPWIHISYNQSDIRNPGDPRRVMTMYQGRFTSGLHKIAGYA